MAAYGQEPTDPLLYFILLDSSFPSGSRTVEVGRLCCMSEEDYFQQVAKDHLDSLNVTMIEEASMAKVGVNGLQPVQRKEAAMLLAVPNLAERVKCILEKGLLGQALRAEAGQQVMVELNHRLYPAMLHFVGNILDGSSLLPALYFGVELEGEGEGLGDNDGTYKGVTFFKCKKNSGLFVPFNKILFSGAHHPSDTGTTSCEIDQMNSVKPGEKVGYYVDDALKQGIAIVTSNQMIDGFVEVLPEDGSAEGLLRVPLDAVVKEETLCKGRGSRIGSVCDLGQNGEDFDPGALEVNSMVQIQLGMQDLAYGIIHWMGNLPQKDGTMVGVELDEDKGVSDGSWQNYQYFTCPPNRGIFVKLGACRPDTRFLVSRDSQQKSLEYQASPAGGADGAKMVEKVPPLQGSAAVDVLQGRMRGIQGHCNSCYMDAALFSLFSCSSALDSLLFKPSPHPDGQIQRTLREQIVNPLRKDGFVSASSVMMLRHQLTQESQCPSFTTSEKDPEEFLNLIMHSILGTESLLKLQSEAQKVQGCYCYQIFIDSQPGDSVPNVQQLLEHSFHHSRLKLAEIPSCFIIQTPRFGKEYKMFSKIIPSLELDITNLLQDSPRECVVCGQLAIHECANCFKDKILSDFGFKQYCKVCAKQVHSHRLRTNHKLMALKLPEGFQPKQGPSPGQIPRETLELFGVLCIETSHYVSFVKYGPEKGSWMFFDSMADRHGNEDGYNIPEVSLCPEVATYLAAPVKDLSSQNPREMKGVAKRLFCDAYMYLYQSKRMALYK
ncbi:ubiquitin carboxyl-terminal hydrolase CYLD-like isoform 2-T2 [Pelodytes ibericus]